MIIVDILLNAKMFWQFFTFSFFFGNTNFKIWSSHILWLFNWNYLVCQNILCDIKSCNPLHKTFCHSVARKQFLHALLGGHLVHVTMETIYLTTKMSSDRMSWGRKCLNLEQIYERKKDNLKIIKMWPWLC